MKVNISGNYTWSRVIQTRGMHPAENRGLSGRRVTPPPNSQVMSKCDINDLKIHHNAPKSMGISNDSYHQSNALDFVIQTNFIIFIQVH